MKMSMERHSLLNIFKVVRQFIVWPLIVGAMFYPNVSNAIDSVVIVSITENGAHQRFSNAFQKKLILSHPDIEIFENSADDFTLPETDSLLVTLGSRALNETVDEKSGVKLHTLISNTLYQKYYPKHDGAVYNLVFDHPLERILRLQSIALPESRNIGVMVGSQSSEFVDKLTREIKKTGRQLVTEPVVEGKFSRSLSNLLADSDSLLLFPDAKVINRTTINTLVLDSYHKKIPLIGYSKALVKAGALLGLYSTPEQLGEDAAEIASRIITGKKVAFHNYPNQFEISVNYKLSRVYGLSLPSEKELHDKLLKGER
ncbi:MAG: hypothetical protein OQK78_01655 [Gammaproteobacteria bacterium]|nr:hypothetical protein [Gammaproteobacteria bacterium]